MILTTLSVSVQRPARRRVRLRTLFGAGALALGAAMIPRAEANASACPAAGCATDAPQAMQAHRNWRYSTGLHRLGADRDVRRQTLSEQDYSAFSGVGLVVCSAGEATKTSTAFLVGQFDLGVTVAHTFEFGQGVEPECSYNSMDSQGQIRERIPVAYVRSQWASDTARGQAATDFAVVRLAQPSRYAQRTMPLGRFSGNPAPAVIVGFGEDVASDTVKRKVRGRVYARADRDVGYPHDIDSGDLAAGAPVIDERTGIIIGVHTGAGQRPNAMISMNDWLESTLRAEMTTPANGEQADAKAN
ncbi:MAG: hypothetical protein RBS02_15870 [Steroidobacteraceae bacterium]|jgi:hypothetical protein|nr:hypothetical protein [Steroidobacteraceae bacterium]